MKMINLSLRRTSSSIQSNQLNLNTLLCILQKEFYKCFTKYKAQSKIYKIGILLGFISFGLNFFVSLNAFNLFALGFLLVWNILEGIAKGILKFQVFPKNDNDEYFTQFFPLEAMSNLIVEPFTRLSLVKSIGTQMGIENNKDYSVHWFGILIVFIWTIIFMLLSYNLLKKRDL